MGKDDAEVNIVTGGGDEADGEGEAVDEYEYEYEYEDEHEDGSEYECEYEGLWVGTIGATEMPEETDESPDITVGREPAQGGDQAKVRGEEQAGQGHNFQVDEQWDLGTDQLDQRADGTRGLLHGPIHRPSGGQMPPPHRAEAIQPRVRARSRETPDRQWEEARHSAWLRQLLSDDSSDEDEDEERYGRFAESGRWITELYGIPQLSTASLGRECSA